MHILIASRAHYFLPLISTVLRISSISPSSLHLLRAREVSKIAENLKKNTALVKLVLYAYEAALRPFPQKDIALKFLASFPRDCVCWMEDELSLVRV
jgi:hypothetical protein